MHWLKEYLAIPPIDQSEWLQFAKLGCIFVETFTIPEKVWIIKLGSHFFLRRKRSLLSPILRNPTYSAASWSKFLWWKYSFVEQMYLTIGPFQFCRIFTLCSPMCGLTRYLKDTTVLWRWNKYFEKSKNAPSEKIYTHYIIIIHKCSKLLRLHDFRYLLFNVCTLVVCTAITNLFD